MANNRNSLIQEYCRDDETPEQPVGGGATYQPSLVAYDEDLNTEEKYIYQNLISPDTEDPIRKTFKYEWVYTGVESETTSQGIKYSKPKIRVFSFSPEKESLEGDIIKESFEIDFEKISQDAVAKIGSQAIVDVKSIKDSIDEINFLSLRENNDFFYLVLAHERPYRKLVDSAIPEEFSITARNEYRSYNKSYEDTNNIVATTVLPNYYVFNEDNFYRSQGGGPEYINSDIASYENTVVPSKAKLIEDFSKIPFDNTVANKIEKKLENVLFPWDKMDLYSDYNYSSTKEAYPYNIILEFNTERVGPMSTILKRSSLNDSLLSHIFKKENEEEVEQKQFTIKGNNSPIRKREEVQIIEIDDQMFEQIDLNAPTYDDLCYLDELETDNIDIPDVYYGNIGFKYNKYLGFEDMMEGKPCYSETLFYKVDKYEIDGEEFQKIQSFYVSNTDEIDQVSILDTQVKYGKKYRYEVFAYKYAMANSYKYENVIDVEETVLTKARAGYDVYITPTPVIVKMLFATIEEVVLDKPSAPPEVEVIPYKDNAEEISFFFNPSTLQYKLQEFAFSEEEERMYALTRDSQNLAPEELITFGGDDKTEKYYIYRTEEHPSSYLDFKDRLYAIAQTEENCVSAEYLEEIGPNKKYYYIFRAVDVHGNMSPPTDVREIELINEDGTIFLHSKIVPFKENKFQKEEKSVKKYIHIKPSLLQSLLDEESIDTETADQAIQTAKLGNSDLEESVWSKSFKMRVKSKSTNKFVDIRFKFIAEKE